MSKRICVFGDSIAWGCEDREKWGWANRLHEFFRDYKKDSFSVYNLGISGELSEKLASRIDIEVKAREAYYIIIGIGLNESATIKDQKEKRVPLEKFRRDLMKIFQKARGVSEKIIFLGVVKPDNDKVKPVSWNSDLFYDSSDAKKYENEIRAFCLKEKIFFIPLYDLLNKEDLFDGLHPNTKGHEKIYRRVKEVLIKDKLI